MSDLILNETTQEYLKRLHRWRVTSEWDRDAKTGKFFITRTVLMGAAVETRQYMFLYYDRTGLHYGFGPDAKPVFRGDEDKMHEVSQKLNEGVDFTRGPDFEQERLKKAVVGIIKQIEKDTFK